MSEVIAPVTEDLTLEASPGLDIIRGLEFALKSVHDFPFADGESFEEGEWGVVDADNKLATPGATGVVNCYPVWCGNALRTDAQATKQVTVITNADWIYRTGKYDTAETYAVGDALTVKSGKLPTLAGVGDAIIGRVFKAPVNGVMEIQVVR